MSHDFTHVNTECTGVMDYGTNALTWSTCSASDLRKHMAQLRYSLIVQCICIACMYASVCACLCMCLHTHVRNILYIYIIVYINIYDTIVAT